GRVANPGTERVTQELDVERYSHVMHLVSHVEAELADGASSFDAVRATFPAGTVSGAPKIRAMEIISELEEDQRGPYAGALGYFGFGGNMETAITIRTIVMQDGVASVQAGGGIVFDSTPTFEFDETVNKAMGMFTALDLAEERSRAGSSARGVRGY
ncbi:MAG: anthranilate synthase component I, partial [Chloroflexi bacterium]|nr:anthranilate synthase component I [Chloroflexota bacterium]